MRLAANSSQQLSLASVAAAFAFRAIPIKLFPGLAAALLSLASSCKCGQVGTAQSFAACRLPPSYFPSAAPATALFVGPMLPLADKRRDPRLASHNASALQHMREQTTRPLKLLSWGPRRASKRRSTNYLFITNLNDNVTQVILKSELSQFDTIYNIKIPTIEGTSAGIASVLLPSKSDPKLFVSQFNGISLFGKKLSVEPDWEASKFRHTLKLLQNPSRPANPESTPPTKDTRADSISPNWSLASQSDPEEAVLGPVRNNAKPHSSLEHRMSKTSRPHSVKRPRPRYDEEDNERHERSKKRSLTENQPYRHDLDSLANCRVNASFSRLHADEQRFSHFSQSRQQLWSRDPLGHNSPQAHTCSSRSSFDAPYSRERNSYREISPSGSRHHRDYSHKDAPYHDNYPGDRWLPRRRYEIEDREHHPYNSSMTYHASPSGNKPKPFPIRSNERKERAYCGKSHISSRKYPGIALRGVPSDIYARDIFSSFREYNAIRVQQDELPRLFNVLFTCIEDREIALRYGCFVFNGVRIQPQLCWRRPDWHSSSKKGPNSVLPPRTSFDGGRTSSYRGSRHFEDRKRQETYDSDEARKLDTSFDGDKEIDADSILDPVDKISTFVLSKPNVTASRQVNESEKSSRYADNSHPQKRDKDSVFYNSSGREEKKNRDKSQNLFIEKSTMMQDHSAACLGETKSRPSNDSGEASPACPKRKESTNGVLASDHGDRKSNEHSNYTGVSPERLFETKDDLFNAVLRFTIDKVSKQHAQLEMNRLQALVARSVFDFLSSKKTEMKTEHPPNTKKTNIVHRASHPANAFSARDHEFQPDVCPRKRKDSSSKLSSSKQEPPAKGVERAPKKLRRSRFSDVFKHTDSSLPRDKTRKTESSSEIEAAKMVQSDPRPDANQGVHDALGEKHRVARVIGSELSGSTALKSSQESVVISKTERTAVIMEESHDNIKKQGKSPSPCSEDEIKVLKHSFDKDPAAVDKDLNENEDVQGTSFEDIQNSSPSVQLSERKICLPKDRVCSKELDKILENKLNHSQPKSSLLLSLKTDSGLPSLGLVSRKPPSEVVPQSSRAPEAPSDEIASTLGSSHQHNEQVEELKTASKGKHAARSKAVKTTAVAKKQSRKTVKTRKGKKDKKSKRVVGLPSRKTKCNAAVAAASVNCAALELSDEDKKQSTETSKKEVNKFSRVLETNDVVKLSAGENKRKCSEQGYEKSECNTNTKLDDREGKCARSEVYVRGQNKNKRRKRLHLESVSAKSALSSRQSRQEKRVYRKGVSKIKPKNDNFINLNSLQQRWKKVQFDRSQIHGMGLYAKENIEADEFVIEYIGDLIRRTVADLREKEYTRQGMGDSYLFRLNSDMVIDATRRGGIARFINHSCDPNVIARKITVDGRSTIAFYSKRAIGIGEELTYDYKFDYEAEDKKIPCLCGAANCRKYLN